MATRSPYNDRYKTEQKGKTRRSASSAKPKRDIADLTPASSTKKAAKKKSWWSTPPAASATVAFESTPHMKNLRRVWWVLWGVSLLIAVGILLLQKGGTAYLTYVPIAWGLWVACMGGAFYLEFGPIRKARAAAMLAARTSVKPSKAATGKSSKAKSVKPAAGDDTVKHADDSSESGDK
jgi:hypothetical protein